MRRTHSRSPKKRPGLEVVNAKRECDERHERHEPGRANGEQGSPDGEPVGVSALEPAIHSA